MALTGDHYNGTYEGHTVELTRNNWVKTQTLLIDGKAVDSASCLLPWSITLTGTLEHNGVQHAVVAKSVLRLLWMNDTIEIDGQILPLTRTR